MSDRVLIVDDEAAVRRTVSRVLGRRGFECEDAESVAAARDILAGVEVDLLICDLVMPEENGLVLVEEVESSGREIAILVATGVDDPQVARSASDLGVDGFLVKPFTNNELQINVEHALGQGRLRHRFRAGEAEGVAAGQRLDAVRSALRDATRDGREIEEERALLLGRLSEAVGQRDHETGEHVRRIGANAYRLARHFGLEEHEARGIGLAAPMHDVGKVAIPDSILLKPGALTDGEWEVMKGHTRIGYEILANSGSFMLDVAAEVALTHHEWVDGSGYPQGLRGDEIPISGRVVAVVDVFDALISNRPYRRPVPMDEAIEIMRRDSGTHFQTDLLDCFLTNLDEYEVPSAEERGGGTIP